MKAWRIFKWIIFLSMISFIFYVGKQAFTPEPTPTPEPKTKVEQKPHTKPTVNKKMVWFKTRYGRCINEKPLCIQWLNKNHKEVLEKEKLEKTIREVYRRLPHVKTSDNAVLLLLEMSVAESYMGKYLTTPKSKAVGVFQILPSTAEDTIKWLDGNTFTRDILKEIMMFYNFQESLENNLKYNVPFNTAMAITYLWRRNVDLWNRIDTLEKRAKIWRVSYNTLLDPDASVEYYIKKAKLL